MTTDKVCSYTHLVWPCLSIRTIVMYICVVSGPDEEQAGQGGAGRPQLIRYMFTPTHGSFFPRNRKGLTSCLSVSDQEYRLSCKITVCLLKGELSIFSSLIPIRFGYHKIFGTHIGIGTAAINSFGESVMSN